MAETDYVPFSKRPGFEDVVPVPQNDGPNAPVQIAYPPAFIVRLLTKSIFCADLYNSFLCVGRHVILPCHLRC